MRKRCFGGAPAIFLAGLLSSCIQSGYGADLAIRLASADTHAKAASGTSGDATVDPVTAKGKTLFASNCAACHDAGTSRAPPRAALANMPRISIVKALQDGPMRAQGASLSADERAAVAKYLSPSEIDAAAQSPPPCAHQEHWFDFSKLPSESAWGVDYGNNRSVSADAAGLSAVDVSKLRLKWAIKIPVTGKVRSQPSFAGGSIFMGGPTGTVYALDRETGCMRWRFDAAAEVRTTVVVGPWDRKAKHHDVSAYFGDLMGNVYAVNALTGTLQWRVKVDDHSAAMITASPVLYGDRLIVPVSSSEEDAAAVRTYACCTFRGSVVALDAKSGSQLWKTYTIREPAKDVGQTSFGARIYAPSGAAVWGTPTIDARRALIYVGTGDAYSLPAGNTSDAIVAMRLIDGAIIWITQTTRNDAWNSACMLESPGPSCPDPQGPDYDFSAPPVLMRLASGKDMIVAGEKSGIVYGLDPDQNGKILWSTRVGAGGILGGINYGMGRSGDSVLAPVADLLVPAGSKYQRTPGLYALHAGTGQLVWSIRAPSGTCSGKPLCDRAFASPPTIIPGVIFQGAVDGVIRAYDENTQQLLWQYDTTQEMKTVSGDSGHGGSIVSVAPVVSDGMLLIASGYTGMINMGGNVVMAFTAP